LRGFVEEGGFWDEAIRLEVGGLNIFLLDRSKPKANLQALVMSGWFQPKAAVGSIGAAMSLSRNPLFPQS
jgi:hypothetical protein